MSARRMDVPRLLRWYPAGWRERYGDELGALIEDTLDGRPLTGRFRLRMAWAGLRERGHQAGLTGTAAPAASRVRTGCLLVLCAWTAFVVAGIGFAKLAEHFGQAVSLRARPVSVGAFGTVQVLAVIGGLLVLAGAAAAGPAFIRFLRAGGWRPIRGHVLRAAGAIVVAAAALAGLTAAARMLTFAQRNGGDGLYSLAFVLTALLLCAALALCAVAAVATVRRLALTRAVLSAEAVLAATVTAAMTAMTVALALWWAAVGSSAPWFLQGTRVGSAASAVTPNLVGVAVLMLAADAVAGYGVIVLARSWTQLRSGETQAAGPARS